MNSVLIVFAGIVVIVVKLYLYTVSTLDVVFKRLLRRVGTRLWRILNKIIGRCLERLRSRESQPRSLGIEDDLMFRSEKVIKRAALFCSFWSLSDWHTPQCAALYRATVISKRVGCDIYESFIDHNKSVTGNQVPNTSDSPEAGGYFFNNVVNVGVPR